MSFTVADPPRRRPLRRWLWRAAGVLVVLVLVGWFAPVVVAKTALRQLMVDRAARGLNGTVAVGSADVGWLSPVELRDVRIADRDGRPVLTVSRVVLTKSLAQLALDPSDVGTVTVEGPVVEILFDGDRTNVEDVFAHWLTAPAGPAAAERVAVSVAVTGGRVVLREAGRDGDQSLENVGATVAVTKATADPIAVTLNASSPGADQPGTVAVELTAHDESVLKFQAAGFPIATFGPVARRFAAGTQLAGRLTADLSVTWGGDENHPRLAVAGHADVADLDVLCPRLGPDRVRLGHVGVPCRVTLDGHELRVEQAEVACDVGTASAAGVVRFDDTADKLLARPGLRADADIDLAKLAAVVPKLLKFRDGTRVSQGRLTAHLGSRAAADGAVWDGSVRTTALKGERAGRPIVWDEPLRADFSGRLRPDGLPVFDKFECLSDFVGLAARGSPEEFVARADVNLDHLAARLSEFVDLGGVTFGGRADVTVQTVRSGTAVTAAAVAKLTRASFREPGRSPFAEPDVTVELRAGGGFGPNGAVRIDAGSVKLTASKDELTLALLTPVADVRSPRTGRVAAKLAGDLGRWRARGAHFGVPAAWEVAGTGTVAATLALTADGAAVEAGTADLTNARFRGEGVTLDEKFLKCAAGATWSRATNAVAVTDVTLHCETFVYTTPRCDLKPTPAGGFEVATQGNLTANLNRVQQALGLQTDPSDAVNGLAIGPVRLSVAGAAVGFDADLVVTDLKVGLAQKPVLDEKSVTLTAAGEYATADDAVRVRTLKVGRDGLSAEASGAVGKLASTRDLDVSGTLNYDLAKLEPQWKAYLGRGSQAVGKESKPFKLAGRLAGGGVGLAVNVGGPAPHGGPLGALQGNAGLGWQALKAYGFEVGPADLTATVDGGAVTTAPVEATFGGGKVRVEPRVDLTSKTYDLTVAKGRVVDRAKLTPAACANAVGYALPAVANVARAEGLVSFDVDDNTVPLVNPEAATVRGRLTVHHAAVSAGPLVTELVGLLGAKQPTLNLSAEQVVPVRLEGGRVYHDGLAFTVGQSTLRTSGSVGLDNSLALVIDLPLPPRFLTAALKSNPHLRDELGKRRVKLPVGGTLAKPVLDHRGLETGVDQVVRAAAAEAGKAAGKNLLKQGEDKLLQGLQKKFDPNN